MARKKCNSFLQRDELYLLAWFFFFFLEGCFPPGNNLQTPSATINLLFWCVKKKYGVTVSGLCWNRKIFHCTGCTWSAPRSCYTELTWKWKSGTFLSQRAGEADGLSEITAISVWWLRGKSVNDDMSTQVQRLLFWLTSEKEKKNEPLTCICSGVKTSCDLQAPPQPLSFRSMAYCRGAMGPPPTTFPVVRWPVRSWITILCNNTCITKYSTSPPHPPNKSVYLKSSSRLLVKK